MATISKTRPPPFHSGSVLYVLSYNYTTYKVVQSILLVGPVRHKEEQYLVGNLQKTSSSMAEEEAILAGWSRTTTTISRCSCSAAVRGLSRCSGRTGKEYYTNHRKRESNLYLYTAFFLLEKKILRLGISREWLQEFRMGRYTNIASQYI